MGLAGGFFSVVAVFSELGTASESFDVVLYVGYLEALAEYEGPEVPFGVVFDGSSGAFCVEVCPEDGVDRS